MSGLRTRDERGSVTIQLVVLLPLLFAALFVGVQAAVWYHARTIAYAAAQVGATAASAETASAGAGIAAATRFARSKGGDLLTGTTITGHRTGTTVTVSVTGSALSVIPGMRFRVAQSASAPVERITGP
jgi:Flp pilus assembly protein TadG